MRVLIDLAFRDPALNLALEEAILDGVRRELVPPTLRIWRNPRCVVVGRGQKPEEEVDLELARRWRIRVVVRPSGGGTVYHHPGNLLFSLFLPLTGKWRSVRESQEELSGLLAEALHQQFQLATEVKEGGVFVGGKKVSGSAQLRRGALLHHGTLLLAPDVIPMEKVLRAMQPGMRQPVWLPDPRRWRISPPFWAGRFPWKRACGWYFLRFGRLAPFDLLPFPFGNGP
jgi:lipoate-protein ligase A